MNPDLMVFISLPKIKDGTNVINLDEYESIKSLDSFVCEW